MTPEEKEEIRKDLVGYITGTVDEWLRLADFETSREGQARQYRISWEHPTDGAMIANVSETRYGEPVARFGVQVTADALPDLPPIGPENDLGIYGIDEMSRTADTLPCWECLTDPTEDPAPWCDCREAGERCKGPCRKRAHAPERCPNLSPAWRAKQVEESYRAEALKQEWVPATLLFCLAGDHIRMGADETDVTRSSAGIWHADTSNAWHPKAWRHTELRMDLTANPGFQQYPPNLECEILCTPERKATLLLQQAFPGSAIISSDVD